MNNYKDIIWITGASGFLGKDISNFLRDKFNIFSVSRINKEANLYFDYENSDEVKKIIKIYGKPQYVLHLGWADVKNNLSNLHLQYNLPSSIKFFKNLLMNKVQNIVFFGTCDEYEGCTSEYDESYSAENYLNKYAGAKYELARIAMEMAIDTDTIFTHLRVFNTYGANKQDSSLLKYILKNKHLDKIHLSDCDYFRDFVYIKDVLKCLELILEKPYSGTLNIGSGVSQNLRKFIEIYSECLDIDFSKFVFGSKVKPAFEMPVPHKPASLLRMNKHLQWMPKYNLDLGLKHMVNSLNVKN
jgi:nucleoside-diphosphate-sugar epimerase